MPQFWGIEGTPVRDTNLKNVIPGPERSRLREESKRHDAADVPLEVFYKQNFICAELSQSGNYPNRIKELAQNLAQIVGFFSERLILLTLLTLLWRCAVWISGFLWIDRNKRSSGPRARQHTLLGNLYICMTSKTIQKPRPRSKFQPCF